jgi:hypothetical protein
LSMFVTSCLRVTRTQLTMAGRFVITSSPRPRTGKRHVLELRAQRTCNAYVPASLDTRCAPTQSRCSILRLQRQVPDRITIRLVRLPPSPDGRIQSRSRRIVQSCPTDIIHPQWPLRASDGHAKCGYCPHAPVTLHPSLTRNYCLPAPKRSERIRSGDWCSGQTAV